MVANLVVNLWFNNNAKEAVDFYLDVFEDAKLYKTDYYTESGEEITGHKKGDLLSLEFEIRGIRFIALNTGPEFSFSPAVSLMIPCKDQQELDYYWERLSWVPEAEQCGWLQDKYGLSWQVVPEELAEMFSSGSEDQRKNLSAALFSMKKLKIQALKDAFKGYY